ncbi:MAG: CoB--CoM heterodisulfide reductase iron-sulfur subunit A [Candidatus Thorarchaeota archaeon AB_25]|nr:MAG: CoB--CoM heterodisulfide reductase iron-sulfur subunit A [Candidatus Thorarchaeota archaeon AB_25]
MSDTDLRIGVFVCNCGLNIAGTVDCEAVAKYAAALPDVTHSVDLLFACSDDGQENIKAAIKEHGLNRVVVASCTPRTHEPVFRSCVEEAGLNRYLYDQVNLREHVSWVHMDDHDLATMKAQELVAMAVERTRYLEPLERKAVDVIQSAAVIGAGVAGISAALDLANAGFETHLIESRPTIGGQMALLDKVFPQNDCAICILGPIMSKVGQHPKINLMTYSELDDVEGYVGNFRLKIRKKSPFIDWEKCNGCGDCEGVCPVSVTSKYEFGIDTRRAAYRPFPQAVPNKYTIDKRGTSPCRIACPAHVNVQAFITLLKEERFDEALEIYRKNSPFAGTLGRVCTNPCQVDCERGKYDEALSIKNLHRFLADYERENGGINVEAIEPDKKKKKKSVAIVGAGPSGLACAYDLVKEGYPVTVFEARREAGGLLRWGIPEYRLPRDVLRDEVDIVKQLGVTLQTGTKIESIKELKDQGFKAVFLATGAPASRKMNVQGENAKGVHHALNFLDRVNSGKTVTIGKNVAVIGGGNAAIDAARTAKRLGASRVTIVYRRSREEMPAIASEVDETEHERTKIEFLATPVEILVSDKAVSGIKCVRMRLGDPDDSGRRRPVPIPDSEFKMKVDTVIIAIGQEVTPDSLMEGLEPTMWGTLEVDPVTLQTNVKGVFGGGDVVSGGASAIEAVATGKEAAKSIHRYLMGENLVEGREEILIPIEDIEVDEVSMKIRYAPAMRTLSMARRTSTFDEVELGFNKATAIAEADRCLSCGVCCECEKCVEACKLDAIDHSLQDEIVELNVGTIIVATGFKVHDPLETREFGFGTFENVITNAQLERLTNAAGPTQGKPKRPSDHTIPKRVAFVQCVGSRDRRFNQDYCCYIGCENSLKQAIQIKEKYPETEIIIYAMDVRTHGLGYEALYRRAREMGVIVVKGRPSEIEEDPETKSLIVMAEDLYTGVRLETTTDLVVLATALLPNDDIGELARKLKVSTGEYGYLMEAHPKLRPVDSFQDGVFLAGAVLGPMDIPKAVAYGKGAAAGAQALMAPGVFYVEPIYAEIDTELCFDCDLCADLCPYGAISGTGEERRVMFELCQGCGTCAAACPKNAIDMRHYRRQQILPQVIAAASVKGELVQ